MPEDMIQILNYVKEYIIFKIKRALTKSFHVSIFVRQKFVL